MRALSKFERTRTRNINFIVACSILKGFSSKFQISDNVHLQMTIHFELNYIQSHEIFKIEAT